MSTRPGWLYDGRSATETLSGSALMYWVALVAGGARERPVWRTFVAETDGAKNPHAPSRVLHIIAHVYGSFFHRAVVLGPYYSLAEARGLENKIYSDDDFALGLAQTAQHV